MVSLPAQLEQLTVPLRSSPVAVDVSGAGRPLVLLHHDIGPMEDSELARALSAYFRVYAPDLPGFGRSPRAEWARHPRDFAGIMLAMARHLGLRDYVLCGLGFGGWVAAEMASFAACDLAHLVLVSAAGMKPDTGDVLDQIMMDHRDYVRAGFSNREMFEQVFPPERAKEHKERFDNARETVARVSWKPYMYSYELPELLKDVATPATVVSGTANGVIPVRCAEIFANTLPNAKLQLIDGGGHFLDLERPAELAALIAAEVLAKE